MLQLTTNAKTSTAPMVTRPWPGFDGLTAPCQLSVVSGDNRLDRGIGAVNGFAITGLEAHAAVRMHVTPASGHSWTYVQKPKATPSSAGGLRRS